MDSGEIAYRNGLDLTGVEIDAGGSRSNTARMPAALDAQSVLIPFGGGIDSVVTVDELDPELERRLCVVSPASGLFAPLERTATTTSLPVIRATRQLDPLILSGPRRFNGHVPVTSFVTLLAAVAAVATGRRRRRDEQRALGVGAEPLRGHSRRQPPVVQVVGRRNPPR
jgi:hypothetical protein